MGKSHSTRVRRLTAAGATLLLAGSLAAAVTAPAGAADGDRADGAAGGAAARGAEVLVRRAPASGEVVVTAGPARESAGLSPAAMRDLRRYAAQSGEDYDALVAAHRGVDEFAAYAQGFEARRPDLYTTSGLDEDGKWVQTTRRPGAAEMARIERLGMDVRVEYGAPASSAELEALAEDLIDSVDAAPGLVESAEASYDDVSRRMVLSYTPAESAPAARVDSTVEGAVAEAVAPADGALPLPVATREVDVDLLQEATIQGGGNLNFQGGAACTAGFTAVRKGKRGVLTARHCPNKMTYGKRRGLIANTAVQTTKKRFDLQWHRTRVENGHQTGVKFRNSRSTTRVVRKAANAPRGSVVCHWGRTSGYSCAKVRATNRCVSLSGQKTCGLDATNRYISAPGDSGGPWFLGNTARGIHAGGGGSTSLFTRIGKAGALGARVLTR